VRFLGKLAELTDRGIPVHLFIGNHDMWIFDYVPKETGVIVHREPIERTIDGKKFLIGHGDGFGPWRPWLQVHQEAHLPQPGVPVVVRAHAPQFRPLARRFLERPQ
jgi:UDP-2,3-diacylglucosamine pyrophosphatase LpxH